VDGASSRRRRRTDRIRIRRPQHSLSLTRAHDVRADFLGTRKCPWHKGFRHASRSPSRGLARRRAQLQALRDDLRTPSRGGSRPQKNFRGKLPDSRAPPKFSIESAESRH